MSGGLTLTLALPDKCPEAERSEPAQPTLMEHPAAKTHKILDILKGKEKPRVSEKVHLKLLS